MLLLLLLLLLLLVAGLENRLHLLVGNLNYLKLPALGLASCLLVLTIFPTTTPLFLFLHRQLNFDAKVSLCSIFPSYANLPLSLRLYFLLVWPTTKKNKIKVENYSMAPQKASWPKTDPFVMAVFVKFSLNLPLSLTGVAESKNVFQRKRHFGQKFTKCVFNFWH